LDLAPKSFALLVVVLGCAALSCGRGPSLSTTAQAAPADAAAPAPAPAPPRGVQLTLVYSANQLASFQPCSCPLHPMGGLARRATQIDRARADADAVLVLEGGDLFLPAPVPAGPPPLAAEIDRRAQLLARAHSRMGLTALVPGERELALGVPRLRRVAQAARVPLVAANLYDAKGKRLFDADRLLAAKGLKVGVFGVTAPPSPAEAADWRRDGIEARDPTAAARDEVASLRARGAELVVALLHLPSVAESRRLLVAVPGIDWAVLGHVGRRYETVQSTAPDGATWYLSAPPEGKELGRVDLHVVDGTAFVDRHARAELESILADHRRQLAEQRDEVDAGPRGPYHETRRQQLEAAIAREEAALPRLPRTIAGSWFENRLIPLDAETPDQIGVALLVDAYRQESARRAAAGKPVGLPGDERPTPPAPLPAPPGGGYAGTAACGRCHAPALAFWEKTKHAQSLAALTRVGHDRDPHCIGCHTTGYLQPGGPADPAAARARFANVGCESCHGPGQAHVAARAPEPAGVANGARGRLGPVGQAICRGCHNQELMGPDFDYPRLAAAVVGPGHGHGEPSRTSPLAPGPRPPL
jgi:2',3'-cyclic-nucleotide 2'-phosphodiesterase (5'-nucleotidase family)